MPKRGPYIRDEGRVKGFCDLYQQGFSICEIASREGVSRQNVSAMLLKAKKLGLVQYPNRPALTLTRKQIEKGLRRYGSRRAFAARLGIRDDVLKKIFRDKGISSTEVNGWLLEERRVQTIKDLNTVIQEIGRVPSSGDLHTRTRGTRNLLHRIRRNFGAFSDFLENDLGLPKFSTGARKNEPPRILCRHCKGRGYTYGS